MRLFFALTAISFFIPLSATAAEKWIQIARKVGESETAVVRESALASLRKQKDLPQRLTKALDTADRPLALDAIGALQMRDLIPELQKRVASDKDGFLTLTLSSLIDEQNKDTVLATYLENLLPERISEVSAAALVSMLEPLGRIGKEIPKTSLEALSTNDSPEVRSALLSYLRVMALSHAKRDNDALIKKTLRAPEFQLRLQTVALMAELINAKAKPILGMSGLEKQCRKEKNQTVRDGCLVFLAKEKS